jgi:hypothetical protein
MAMDFGNLPSFHPPSCPPCPTTPPPSGGCGCKEGKEEESLWDQYLPYTIFVGAIILMALWQLLTRRVAKVLIKRGQPWALSLARLLGRLSLQEVVLPEAPPAPTITEAAPVNPVVCVDYFNFYLSQPTVVVVLTCS